eukprot:jgi/Tetstr1/447619/TSEL_034980.t1
MHNSLIREAVGSEGARKEYDVAGMITRVLDDETGELRLPCISCKTLPFCPEEDPVTNALFDGDFLLRCIERAQTTEEDPLMEEHAMEVYGSTNFVGAAEYWVCTCPSCNMRLEPDGKEHGVLVVSRQIAFTYELLYKGQFQFGVEDRPMHSFWRATVEG